MGLDARKPVFGVGDQPSADQPDYSLCYMYSFIFESIILSRDMRFPTEWYERPTKAQTSLRIRTDWLEPLIDAWIFYEY